MVIFHCYVSSPEGMYSTVPLRFSMNSSSPSVLGIGLRLHIGSLAEFLHRAQLRSANAAGQGADAAVLDR